MKLITELFAKELNRQEGYGRTGKPLSNFQKNYLDKLEGYLEDSGLKEKFTFQVANTLVRLRRDSLERLIDEGYLTGSLKRLVEKIKKELQHYQENGFTEKQRRAMITRLFSWQRIKKFLDSGLGRQEAIEIVIHRSNPEKWWEKAKPIRDELMTDGLSKYNATKVVKRTNPKEWWEKAKLIRDKLMIEGLGRYDATQIIIRWSNPEERWKKRAKSKRDKLMADGLGREDATQIVIHRSNPEKWWEKAKPIRDELMTDGLSKCNATKVVIMHTNPEEWWETAKPLVQNLKRKLGFSKALRLVLNYRQSKIKEFFKGRE